MSGRMVTVTMGPTIDTRVLSQSSVSDLSDQMNINMLAG